MGATYVLGIWRERLMSKMKEWLLDRQENGDDGTGYEGEGERDDE